MNRILESSKYLVLIGVVSLLSAAAAAFLWGGLKTVFAVMDLVTTLGKDPLAAITLIELMDTFLIATALLIFAVGLYELFLGEVRMPPWLVIHNLHDLKAKLASVIVLVLAVTFLKHLVEWQDPKGTLLFGIATALIAASLILFGHLGEKD